MRRVFGQVLPDTPAAVFRLYMATVLIQFAALSYFSVPLHPGTGVRQGLLDLVLASNYWWGNFSLFGAASLVMHSKFAAWKFGALIGELSAVCMFAFLSWEYLTCKPPLYVGGVLAGTAALFLVGGLISDKRRAT